MDKLNISILPAGAWGTALAIPLSDNGHNVSLYFRQGQDAKGFNLHKINLNRLPNIKFSDRVNATLSLKDAVRSADILVLACNSSHVRSLFQDIKPFLTEDSIILCVSKGVEEETNLVMSQVIEDIEPKIADRLAVLSGPNFAQEIAQRLPALTVIASVNRQVAKLLQKSFTTSNFRVYTQDDVLGVELGGALKNVIAIGVGIGDGLKMGENCRTALITRGVGEMIKLGVALGAKKSTFNGLSGVGDLILCCTSGKSRNHQTGVKIGQGLDVNQLIASTETVEGLHTTKAVIGIAKRKKISLPIMEMVYKIVYQSVTPRYGFDNLMRLELSSENDD